MLPNVQVDGTLNIEGEVFVPTGASISATEIDVTIVKQNGNVVANDNAVVHKTGDETIEGVKTFTSSPTVPTPTNGNQAVNKEYVDSGAGATFVADDGRVKTALNASGDTSIYACRAWVNFDGTRDSTGATSTANTARFIRDSGNVSSVVRNAVGNYTVNFTTAMPDANYGVSGAIGKFTSTDIVTNAVISTVNFSTTSFQFVTTNHNTDTNFDNAAVTISIVR